MDFHSGYMVSFVNKRCVFVQYQLPSGSMLPIICTCSPNHVQEVTEKDTLIVILIRNIFNK